MSSHRAAQYCPVVSDHLEKVLQFELVWCLILFLCQGWKPWRVWQERSRGKSRSAWHRRASWHTRTPGHAGKQGPNWSQRIPGACGRSKRAHLKLRVWRKLVEWRQSEEKQQNVFTDTLGTSNQIKSTVSNITEEVYKCIKH